MALSIRRAGLTAAALVIGAGGLAACGANEAQNGSEGGDGAKKIALLLPESKTTRYEAFDKPLFEDKVAELCSDCEVVYFNADQDPAKQQQQVETAITDQVDAMVLDPVDGEAAAGLVVSAQEADIPVIAYDRFIEGSDYYMSFDNAQVGKLQAESLVEAVGGSGGILMLNGAPTDPNAAQFKEGAHSVLDSSGVDILAEYDNPDWSPDNAQQWTTDQLGKYEPAEVKGVYAANDGQAGADGQEEGLALVDDHHGHHRSGQTADRADGQVDLAEQQHQHDADRDDADGRREQRDVDQRARGQERRVLGVEDQ